MRYRSGDSDQRHEGRRRPPAAAEGPGVPPQAGRATDTSGDACAIRLTESLEDAVLALDAQPAGFEDAARKADHVEELRRILGILLDVLADWEMLADREARGP
ncbi:hypothetical protein [Actinoallomurus rhizosphaericola]|uniref:hypothetical protein n=1 Tax=Actinoallomurus rhizosphaericola TaxID=2952536 RepID=UPI002090F36A|nr:hypothetical protein [Actinoallomurus rhizosphaericola]MCO5992810.1 hypothetical protein [Actinoallomurus rhizosphaericola]